MEASRAKGKNRNAVYRKFDDPELEAERLFAEENDLPPPKALHTTDPVAKDTVKKIAEALINGAVDNEKISRNGKAERKARSRGVSGCSSKKDGGRFEYGLDCMDLAYNQSVFDGNSTDSEADYDEYSDYVFKYSDTEIRSIVQDYLLNGNREDAMSSLEKFRITGDTMSRMMKDLIQLSLEGHSAGGLELGSQLVDEIMELEWLSATALVNILEEIVDSLQDLSIDNPKIVEVMSVFMAKLVEKGIITSSTIKFIAAKNTRGEEGIAKQCCEDALTFSNNRILLQGKCVPAGGHQSLEVLSAQFKMILKEYLHSNDKDVVCLRVKELKVPHFSHEFIYQAGILAMEKMHDVVMTSLADLLKSMYENGIIFESCIKKGYEKLYQSLNDLYLDLPAAYALARRWVDKSLKAEFIPDVLAKHCPARTRSRTLSADPDGKLSCMEEDDNDENTESATKKDIMKDISFLNGDLPKTSAEINGHV